MKWSGNTKTIAVPLLVMSLAAYAMAGSAPVTRDALLYYVNENAKNLPMRTDAATTVTGVALLSHNVVLWRYKIDAGALLKQIAQQGGIPVEELTRRASAKYGNPQGFITATMKEGMAEGVARKNCNTPAVRDFLERGVIVKHAYFFLDESLFFEAPVDISSCR